MNLLWKVLDKGYCLSLVNLLEVNASEREIPQGFNSDFDIKLVERGLGSKE